MNNKNLVLILIIFCVITLFLNIVNTFNKSRNIHVLKGYKNEKINKIVSSNKIAIINLNGIIESRSNESFSFSQQNDANSFLKAIKEAQNDNQVKGVVLKINTPGGTVGMSQNIYDAIIRLRKIKPVVVFMEDVAASGGYYIASAADRIIAQSGTITGSIGVIFSTVDAHQLLQSKLLIEPNVIKSGKYKDIGSQLKKMTDDEKQLLQNIVNDSYNQFIRAIINGRIERNDNYSVPSMQLDMETLSKYADGRIFTGSQAKTFGFIDSNGDLDYAIEFAKVMASEKYGIKVKNLNVQNYPVKKDFNFYSFISEMFNTNKTQSSMMDALIPTSVKLSHKPLYLWE